MTSSIAYTNMASLIAKYDNLITFVRNVQASFLLVSETWLDPDVPDALLLLDGFISLDNIASVGEVVVSVYVADHILSKYSVSIINYNTENIESLFLQVTDKILTFVLGCIYGPPLLSIERRQIAFSALSKLASNNSTVFIFGDFDLPDINWSLEISHKYSVPSQLLLDLLLSHHLIQLVDQPTRSRAGQQPSTLVLILTSDDDLLANLEYLDPVGNADHVVLKVNIQIGTFRRKRAVSTVTDYKSINEDLKKLG
ncbi:hypothetical protein Zmor_007084 [Zophobas morio]|uniref:Endonuclease/exonuclease/phosphatase domain-containing protein n=1 Tax=Zophobas morio TaxID=2755281 RepID=A0AA38MP06_9CUCU|nr:hypothetical protein Zmor_007084 [Zophobas morio]